MNVFPKLTELKPLPNYRLSLTYSDGSTGEVDLSGWAGKGVFEQWLIQGEFEKAHIGHNGGAVIWVDELDMCADSLYLKLTGKTFEEYAENK